MGPRPLPIRGGLALAAAAALIAPSLALAATDGGTAMPTVAPQPAGPLSGGTAAPPPVPTLRPASRVALPVQRPTRPQATASQETEAPGEVPKLQPMQRGKAGKSPLASATVAPEGRLPQTGYAVFAIGTLGLAMLLAGSSLWLLAPRDDRATAGR